MPPSVVQKSATIEVLLLLRHPHGVPPGDPHALGRLPVRHRKHLDTKTLLHTFRAESRDIAVIKRFAGARGLKVVRVNRGRRTIVLGGSIRKIQATFGARAHSVPKQLTEVVTGVFGIDKRPVGKRPGRRSFPPPESAVPPPVNSKTRPPKDFRSLYEFPRKATGKGECIGVLEFGGGFERRKLDRYLATLGVEKANIVVREIKPGRNRPTNQPGILSPDAEVYMDLEILASLAPEVKIVVYFAENSSRGWIDALHTAIFDQEHKPSILSISWGQAEQDWDAQTIRAINEALSMATLAGITVCCSSGDRGVFEAGKPYTIAFPASSPLVLACGGTQLDVISKAVTRETVWNESRNGVTSGGGFSKLFEAPAFQKPKAKGRGIPDVAANASSATGYLIIADETPMSLGGTSAAAPLWAALIACLNQALGRRIGYLTPLLYTGKPGDALRGIVKGNNQLDGRQGYKARKGWDACTGLGTPHGTKLLRWLKQS